MTGTAARTARACLLLIPAVLLTTGCHGITVRTAYGPGVRFDGFGPTFAWWNGVPRVAGGEHASNPHLDQMVRETIAERLRDKGYVEIDNGVPDFWIDYQILGRTFATGREPTLTRVHENATLLLDIIEPETERLIWRGYARRALKGTESPPAQCDRLHDAVKMMLDRFLSEGQK